MVGRWLKFPFEIATFFLGGGGKALWFVLGRVLGCPRKLGSMVRISGL